MAARGYEFYLRVVKVSTDTFSKRYIFETAKIVTYRNILTRER